MGLFSLLLVFGTLISAQDQKIPEVIKVSGSPYDGNYYLTKTPGNSVIYKSKNLYKIIPKSPSPSSTDDDQIPSPYSVFAPPATIDAHVYLGKVSRDQVQNVNYDFWSISTASDLFGDYFISIRLTTTGSKMPFYPGSGVIEWSAFNTTNFNIRPVNDETCETFDETDKGEYDCQNGICTIRNGFHVCQCLPGFHKIEDGTNHLSGCEDIDECKQYEIECGSDEFGTELSCFNTLGSYYCDERCTVDKKVQLPKVFSGFSSYSMLRGSGSALRELEGKCSKKIGMIYDPHGAPHKPVTFQLIEKTSGVLNHGNPVYKSTRNDGQNEYLCWTKSGWIIVPTPKCVFNGCHISLWSGDVSHKCPENIEMDKWQVLTKIGPSSTIWRDAQPVVATIGITTDLEHLEDKCQGCRPGDVDNVRCIQHNCVCKAGYKKDADNCVPIGIMHVQFSSKSKTPIKWILYFG
jgi:hypothetical protein